MRRGARDIQAPHLPTRRHAGGFSQLWVPGAWRTLQPYSQAASLACLGMTIQSRSLGPQWYALSQNEGNPALNDVVYSIGGLLPPAIRERIAAFSFTCLPMQLHAVSEPALAVRACMHVAA